MTAPTYEFKQTKTDLDVNDDDPNSTPPAADRLFTIQPIQQSGAYTGSVTFRVVFADDFGKTYQGKFDAQLYGEIAGVYESPSYSTVTEQWATLPTTLSMGGFVEPSNGFIRFTNISAEAGATKMIIVGEVGPIVQGAPNVDGFPQVGLTGQIPLPSGAATAANQVLEIAQLVDVNAELDHIQSDTGGIASNTSSLSQTTAVADAVAPSRVEQDGGYAALPADPPAAVVKGRLKALWVSLRGALFSKLLGPDDLDLFPSASAAADDGDNSTLTSIIRARLMGFNGTTWDRLRTGQTAVTSTLTGFLNELLFTIYNASPTTRTEGQGGPLQSDLVGNLRSTLATLIAGEDLSNNVLATVVQPLSTNTHAMTFVDGIAVTGIVAKGSAGNLYTFWGYNGNGSTRYIQVFNAISAPVDGTAPLLAPIPVAAGQIFSLDLTPFGRYFSTGIYICGSTTAATKTLGSADLYISAGVG